MRGPAQSRNPARVLVVDDYRPLADMLVKMLEARGHDARVAYDGATALAVAEEFQPQALIADVFMKDMDGFKLAAEFNRRFPGSPHTVRAISGVPLRSREHSQTVDRAGGHLRACPVC